jgi:signal transduction histidine kinase
VIAIDRAIALATTTLKYGRSEDAPPQRSEFCLAALVEECATAAMEACASHAVVFENQIAQDLTINADREQLFRIVLNLLRNACEALSDAGAVTVCAQCGDNAVAIEIADNGPGIAKAVRAKLFQPFVSAARPGGSGLGLAIARDLARGHGGDVVLVSTGAQGTLFRVTLPRRVKASGFII